MAKTTLKQDLFGLAIGGTIMTGALFSSNYFYNKAEEYNAPEVAEAMQIQRILKNNPQSLEETTRAIQASTRYSQLLSQDKTLPKKIEEYNEASFGRLSSMACFWPFLLVMAGPSAYRLTKRAFPSKSPLETKQLTIMD